MRLSLAFLRSIVFLCLLELTLSQSIETLLVDDVLSQRPPGVRFLWEGPHLEDFDRPLPQVVETSLFHSFESLFNQIQEFHAEGLNTYHASGRQFVAEIEHGRVTGVLGEVSDIHGRVFSQFAPSTARLQAETEQLVKKECKQFKRLATPIQKYGHMYYHFVQEVLPRIIMLKPFLDAETKLLMFGSSYEFEWLALLGILPEQVEVYDPSVQYCADQLLVPPMSPVVTPAKENYELLRSTFHADVALPEAERNIVVYCSRRKAADRRVANEAELLSTIEAMFPSLQLYIYTGDEEVAETIQLFRRARVVIGMHGAGLSHSIFSAPDTAVVELLFMSDPPLMFWHAASALHQRYIMVPLPQSWWLDPSVNVSVQDVMDGLALAMDADDGECQLGFFKYEATGECLACPAGTYRPAGESSCLPCAAGRAAGQEGSAFCIICTAGSFSDSGFECLPCPTNFTTVFSGATSRQLCIPTVDVGPRLLRMFDRDVLTEKLVSLPALEQPKPRSLFEWVAAAVRPANLEQQARVKNLRYLFLNHLFNTETPKQQHSDANSADASGPTADTQRQERRLNQEIRGTYSSRRALATGYNRRSLIGYHRLAQ